MFFYTLRYSYVPRWSKIFYNLSEAWSNKAQEELKKWVGMSFFIALLNFNTKSIFLK